MQALTNEQQAVRLRCAELAVELAAKGMGSSDRAELVATAQALAAFVLSDAAGDRRG